MAPLLPSALSALSELSVNSAVTFYIVLGLSHQLISPINGRRGMEFASLEDAFPNSGPMRKKALRKPKDEGFQAGEYPPTDADRPAVKRMSDIPPMRQDDLSDPNDPTSTYLDESTKFLKKPSVLNSLPKPSTLTSFNPLKNGSSSSYFGAEPFTNPSEDTLSPFVRNSNNPNGYMLENDFTKSFNEKGLERAAGADLPVPELRHRWKLMSKDRVESSQIDERMVQKTPQFNSNELSGLRAKIDELMARIDDLENRASGANPQLEVMTFIMTGLFLMFIVDLAVRKSGNMRMVNVR
jgi:hypothetical protein